MTNTENTETGCTCAARYLGNAWHTPGCPLNLNAEIDAIAERHGVEVSTYEDARAREVMIAAVGARLANVSTLPSWLRAAAWGQDMTALAEITVDAMLAASVTA